MKYMKSKPEDDFFEKRYPGIAGWVQNGWIEIGRSDWGGSFIKVLDEGGLVWEGARKYTTVDDALADAERAINRWLEENG